MRDTLRKPSDNTYSYLNDGIRETLVGPPNVIAAIKAANVHQLPTWMRVLARINNIRKIGITGLNLKFITQNPEKDLPSSVVNTRAGFATLKHVIGGMWDSLGHSEFYRQVAAEGGGGSMFDMHRETPKLTVERMRAGRSASTMARYTLRHPEEILRLAEDIASTPERAVRFMNARAEQARLLKMPHIQQAANPQREALLGAVESYLWSTAPFHRHGEMTGLRTLGTFLPAGIQGNRVTLGAIRDHTRATVTKLGLLALPVATITAWNVSDPKRKAIYDDLKTYEKDNVLLIVTDNAKRNPLTNRYDGIYRISMQQNLAKFAAFVRRPIEAYAGLDPIRFGEFATTLLGSVSPVSTPQEAFQNLDIGAIHPLAETYIGEGGMDTFRNEPIEPMQFLREPDHAKRVRDNTSGTARFLARPFDAGPMKTQHLFGGYFGGGGRQFLNLSDQALYQMGVIPKQQISGTDPITNVASGYVGAQALNDRERTERDARRRGVAPSKRSRRRDLSTTKAQQDYLDDLMNPYGKR